MRHCLVARVDPALVGEYRRRHAEVWPEMLQALRAAGWRDYTLHLGDDGLLVAVVDVDDLDRAREAMAATAVNRRWQEEMARFLGSGAAAAGDPFTDLPLVFDLEAQLADHDARAVAARPAGTAAAEAAP